MSIDNLIYSIPDQKSYEKRLVSFLAELDTSQTIIDNLQNDNNSYVWKKIQEIISILFSFAVNYEEMAKHAGTLSFTNMFGYSPERGAKYYHLALQCWLHITVCHYYAKNYDRANKAIFKARVIFEEYKNLKKISIWNVAKYQCQSYYVVPKSVINLENQMLEKEELALMEFELELSQGYDS
ncbi:MAG: hypothetical protein AAF846_14265 [Chloroflexota bacterium]